MSAIIAMQFAIAPNGVRPSQLQMEAQDLMNQDIRWLNTRGPCHIPQPVLQFRDHPERFGYTHFTEDHLRQAIEALNV